jgi:predicted nucleic acid-binding protein
MNVYVESNFVLEQALEQEQSESCQRLLSLSAASSIHLVIPAFSLAEPYIALMHKGSERSKLGTELQRQLSELGRSKPYRDASGSFNELTALLIRSAEGERAGLERAVEGILRTAEVIPLDSNMFYRAAGIRVAFDMSIQDATVLASVVHHLNETKPAESCFLNRNTRDFDDPNVRELLEEFGCKFFGRFDNGLQFIEAQLRKAEQ